MDVLLYEFRWNNPEQVEFQASHDDRFGRKPLTLGDSLSVEVKATVKCAGSMRDGLWQSCQQQVVGRKKCDVCRNREGNFVVTSFDGFNTDMFTPEDLERLQGPHVVYLALFEAGLKKVGVSKLERKTLRQVEQGSHHTLFVAQTPDGILARQIETCLRQSGLADKIPANAKKNFICPELSPSQGETELKESLEAGMKSLEHHPELKKFLLKKPEFCDWSTIYGVDKVASSPKPLHLVKLAVGESVSGTIVAIKGPFIMLETLDEIICLCTKDLQGLTLNFTPQPVGLNLNTALQNALF